MRKTHRSRGPAITKGLASGAMGGLVASWAMNQFQLGWNKASKAIEKKRHPRGETQERQKKSDGEDSTMRTAEWIAEGVFHHPLTKEERKKLGPVVHYAFGAAMGAMYGALAELTPKTATGDGLAFGSAVFVGADELSLWALGLAGPPTQYPVSAHVQAFAAHCVYGLTTENVRRTIRRFW